MAQTAPAFETPRKGGGCGCAGAMLAAAGGGVGAAAVLGIANEFQARGFGPSLLAGMIDLASLLVICSLAAFAIFTGLRLMSDSRDPADRPLRLFERRGAGRPLLVFALALAAGQLALLGSGGGIAIVVAHPLAAAMPALAVIAAIAFQQRGAEPAPVFRGLVWGAAIATFIAFVAEVLVLGVIALLLFMGLRSSPEGLAVIESLRGLYIQFANAPEAFDPSMLDSEEVAAILLRPSFVLAAFGLFGLFGPAIEELAKVGGVAVIRPRDKARAFLVGAACGAGFGFAEALLLGMAGLGPLWAASMLVRVFSTLMHALLSGIAGLGWYALAAEGRWIPGVRGIALAIIGHGLWNSLVLAAVIGGIAAEFAHGSVAKLGSAMAITAPLGLVLLIYFFLRRLRTVAADLGDPDANAYMGQEVGPETASERALLV